MAESGLRPGPALSDHWSFQVQVFLGAVNLPLEMVSNLEKPHEAEEARPVPAQLLTSLTQPQERNKGL